MRTESLSVIIATRNRPELLRQTLDSLENQSRPPQQVFVVDSSDGSETAQLVRSWEGKLPLEYLISSIRSAARQRNEGASQTTGSLLLFLDDDVVLEPAFIEKVVAVFECDREGVVGGVSGTIVNQTFSEPSSINRFLLRFCIGHAEGGYAGRVVGPAVNFLPRDDGRGLQTVEWLPSGCVTYRRDVFMTEQFPEHYTGYSYAEDLHLSTRVGQRHKLLNTTEARLFHEDAGKSTHRDWVALGESIVIHRHEIMIGILNRRSVGMHLRLFCYEGLYQGLLALREFLRTRNRSGLELQWGRFRGLAKVLLLPSETGAPR